MATRTASAEKQEAPSTDVAVFGTDAQLPADVGSELEGLEGLGYSERAEDSLVPILALLQDNSAEVKRQHAKYIEGAKPGDLIIRSLARVIDPEATQVIIQPCGFQHVWVEWDGEPGDGVPVATYPFDERPDDAVEREDPQNEDRRVWTMPSGNRLVDTRYHYCQLLIDGSWMPIVVPMAGTNHTVSRAWTTQQKQFTLHSGGRAVKAPAWFRAYQLRTKFNQRGSQSWFTYDPKDAGWITDSEVRAAGRTLYESLQSNTIAADIASEASDAAASSDESDSIPV